MFDRSVANLRRVLAEAGARDEQIVKINAYVRDEERLPLYNELFVRAFLPPRPARTTVTMGFEFPAGRARLRGLPGLSAVQCAVQPPSTGSATPVT